MAILGAGRGSQDTYCLAEVPPSARLARHSSCTIHLWHITALVFSANCSPTMRASLLTNMKGGHAPQGARAAGSGNLRYLVC